MIPEVSAPGETALFGSEKFRFQPATSLEFPPNPVLGLEKVSRIRQEDDQQSGLPIPADKQVYKFTLAFLGLYGPHRALPSYFSRLIAAKEPGWQTLKEFLDIFNHRIYALYYQAWKKYRHHLASQDDVDDLVSGVILRIGGIMEMDASPGPGGPKRKDDDANDKSGDEAAQVSPAKLLSAAGILGRTIKSVDGLEMLISGYFDDMPTRVKQFVPRWETITTRMQLGDKAFGLGVNSTVGKRVLDLTGKIGIELGPLEHNQLQAFVSTESGGKEPATLRKLKKLIKYYIADDYHYDIEVLLRTDNILPMKLGGQSKLGWDSFMGKPGQTTVSVLVARC